jgi:hypothetical protein
MNGGWYSHRGFMKNMNPIIAVGAIVLLVLTIFLWSRSRVPTKVSLPSRITTVAAGYPFALQLKNRMASQAHLTTVVIDIDREGNQFGVSRILYGFALPNTNGRVFGITVNNMKHEASAVMDAPSSPDSPYMSASRSTPLDIANVSKEISEVLEIAKTNGLDEFCKLASPQNGNVSLGLFNASSSPVWNVTGDGWDEKGPIADLTITINARTGVVINRNLQKAVNRP